MIVNETELTFVNSCLLLRQAASENASTTLNKQNFVIPGLLFLIEVS